MAFGIGEILGIVGVAGVPATLALTMPATTRGEFRFLKGCLLLSGALIIASLFLIEWKDGSGVEMKMLVNAAIAAVVVGGLTYGMDWLEKKQGGLSPEAKRISADDAKTAGKNNPNITAAGNIHIGQIGDIINQAPPPTADLSKYEGVLESNESSHENGSSPPLMSLHRKMEVG